MSGRSRVVLAATIAIAACGRVAGDEQGLDAAKDATTKLDAAASFGDVNVTLDAGPLVPEAAAPPLVTCVDAGDSSTTCPLPPSTCLDGEWLEYFDNGICVDGTCRYDAVVMQCSYGCSGSGCVVRLTTPNVRPNAP